MWGTQKEVESGIVRQNNGRQAVALSAERVSYEFVIAEEKEAWRLAFGSLKDLPRFQALEDVSIIVPKGKFVGILGRNGAGKTTLLRTLGGAYARTHRSRICGSSALGEWSKRGDKARDDRRDRRIHGTRGPI
jgi:ABC-type glutathione transport system ATPase component